MSEQEQKQIFTRNLNNLLIEHGKTQAEVANTIGVSQQTFNTWVRGVAIPRMDKIQKLADYFGVQKSALVDREHFDADAVYGNADNDMLAVIERMKDDARFRRLIRYALLFGDERIEKINALFGEMENESGKTEKR